MALTLLEAAKNGNDIKVLDGIKIITERSPILEMMPFREIKGNSLTRYRERTLGSVGTRGVGETWTRTAGTNEAYTERLTIHGGEVFIDNFEVKTMGNLIDIKADQFRKKERAMSFHFSEQFFEGDSSVDARSFDGLRVRVSRDFPNQMVEGASGGEAFDFDALDETLEAVVGENSEKVIFMNKTMRRIVTASARRPGTATGHPLLDVGTSALGRQVLSYDGAPIKIIEREDNAATLLDFDESDTGAAGGNLDTSSIWVVRFGTDYVSGIRGEGSVMTVKDFGETESAPGHLGRIEAYWGLNVHHPRSVARYSRINNAFPS